MHKNDIGQKKTEDIKDVNQAIWIITYKCIFQLTKSSPPVSIRIGIQPADKEIQILYIRKIYTYRYPLPLAVLD